MTIVDVQTQAMQAAEAAFRGTHPGYAETDVLDALRCERFRAA